MASPDSPSIMRRLARNELREVKSILARVVQEDLSAELTYGFVKWRRAIVYMNRGVIYAILSAKGVRPFGVSCPDERGLRWIVQRWLGEGN